MSCWPDASTRAWPAAAASTWSSTCGTRQGTSPPDRKSTRLNSSHTEIYTLSLHDAIPFWLTDVVLAGRFDAGVAGGGRINLVEYVWHATGDFTARSEEHTSELQSHRDLHSFPTRRYSVLADRCRAGRTLRRGRGRRRPHQPGRVRVARDRGLHR